MKLEELLVQLRAEKEIKELRGNGAVEVTGLVYDTRKEITQGNLFVCISGAVFDGHEYAETAVAA